MGFISVAYISRSTTYNDVDYTDQDLRTKVGADLIMSDNAYEFHFFGENRTDLDPVDPAETAYDPFRDLGDTQEASSSYVYEAHFDMNHVMKLNQLRLGRQASTRDGWIYFDGIAADLKLSSEWFFTVSGGKSVHYHETTPGSDVTAIFGVDYSPLESTKLSLDVLSAKDERTQRKEVTDQNDQMVSLKLQQLFAPGSKGIAKVRWLNGETRDMTLSSLNSDLAGFELYFRYFRQLLLQQELSNETSLFYDVLGDSNPYHSYDLKVRKEFADNYSLSLGYFARALLDTEDESVFNREYSRAFTVFEVYEFLMENLSLSLTGEQWQSKTYEGNSGGFDLEYRNGKKRALKVNVGTYFSLYKYEDYLELGERTEVQTQYVKATIPVGEHYKVTGGVEMEQSLEDYQTMKVEVRRDF
ncbi:MAG: hypothetical protein HQM11_15395 [SAR324 cluster bacterium]|nr:hypothetical protein [SAR324 cluster bacterium]